MSTQPQGTQALRQAMETGRWIWPIFVVVQIANLFDWMTTIVGIGLLGLPEKSATVRLMIRQWGILNGVTVSKLMVAMAAAGIAWMAAWLCGLGTYKAQMSGLTWLLVAMGVLLSLTVVSNVLVIVLVVTGAVRP